MNNASHTQFQILQGIPTPGYQSQWMANAVENELMACVAVAAAALVLMIRFQKKWYLRLVIGAVAFGCGVFSIWVMELLRLTRDLPIVPICGAVFAAIAAAKLADTVLTEIAAPKQPALGAKYKSWALGAIACLFLYALLLWISEDLMPAVIVLGFFLFIKWPARPQKDTTAEDAKKFDAMLLRAGKGEAAAQFALGKMYQSGKGVAQSDIGALNWFQKAAAQGHGEAKSLAATLEAKLAAWQPSQPKEK